MRTGDICVLSSGRGGVMEMDILKLWGLGDWRGSQFRKAQLEGVSALGH